MELAMYSYGLWYYKILSWRYGISLVNKRAVNRINVNCAK